MVDAHPLKDFNLVMETEVSSNKITFQWSIRNINKLPAPIRSSRFSMVSGQPRDWDVGIGLGKDNTFRLSLAYHAQKGAVPIKVESNSRMLKNEGTVLVSNYQSTNEFYGGDQHLLFSRVKLPESTEDKLVFHCSMTVHRYSVVCSRNLYNGDGGRDVEELMKDYLSMMKSKEFADVKITIKDRCFDAHRCVLKHLAPKFFSDHHEGILRGELVLEDVMPEMFKVVLQSIYDGNINKLAIILYFKEFYVLAIRYELKRLLWACTMEIIFSMNMDNVSEFYEMASMNNDKKLMKYCKEFMKYNQ